MAITATARKKAEELIYKVMDALDSTKSNSDHYKQIFSKMSDIQFEKLFKQEFPLRFHERPFEIEPTEKDTRKALQILGVPKLEKVSMPYLYENKDGVPVQSKECQVGYIHIKKTQQFLTKKNSISTNIDLRDVKTGALLNADKKGKTSDREAEALVTLGLNQTLKEFTGFRADAMNSKNQAYNMINTTGKLNLDEITTEADDSVSKELYDSYMLGSMIKTNIITDSYLLPYYSKNKKKDISRK